MTFLFDWLILSDDYWLILSDKMWLFQPDANTAIRMPVIRFVSIFVFLIIERNIESCFSLKTKKGRTEILYLIVHQIEGQVLPSTHTIA